MRFLSFSAGNDEFGIPLEQVREVIGFPEFTSVPNSPHHFLGIMSLRDEVVPVIDLRIKLKIEPTLTEETAVVICDVNQSIFGLVVDIIHNVVAPADEYVTALPELSQDQKETFLLNAVRHNNQFILILDAGKLITASDQALTDFKSSNIRSKVAA